MLKSPTIKVGDNCSEMHEVWILYTAMSYSRTHINIMFQWIWSVLWLQIDPHCTIFKRKLFALLRLCEAWWVEQIDWYLRHLLVRPSLCALLHLARVHAVQCTQRRGRRSDESLCFVFSYPVTRSAWAASAGYFFLARAVRIRSDCCMLQSPPTVCSSAVSEGAEIGRAVTRETTQPHIRLLS